MMFAPFAFIQPENLADIISGASTSSLFVVGDFFTYKATHLGNVAILTNSGSRTFLPSGLSSFNQGGDDPAFNAPYPGFVGTTNQQNVLVVFDCVLEPSNKLTIVGRGEFYSGSLFNRRINRVTQTGQNDPDSRFGTFNNYVITSKLLRNGSYIFSGAFTTYSGSTATRLIKTNNSGTIDTTFNPGTSTDNYAFSVVEDASNRLILGGNFSTYSGSTVNYIVRLNTNGTIDNTFKTGTGFNGTTYGIVLQSDGKIIVTGGFTTYSGSSTNRIVRLNTDGTLDTTYKAGQTFNPTFGSQYPAVGLGIQSDNKVIAYGDFTQYSGSTRNRITRINTDGTLDTTFNPGSGFDRIDPVSVNHDGRAERKIQIDSAGKIYVADAFTSYSGSKVNGLIKLNSDGTIDTTFDYTGSVVSGIGYNSWDTSTSQNRTGAVSTVSITGSSVAIGGYFRTWKEPVAYGIVRLDLSGSSYTGTNLHTFGGFQYQSYSVTWYQADVYAIKSVGTKYLICGNFTQYNSSGSNRIIMLNSDFSVDQTFKIGTGFNSRVQQIHYIPSTQKILTVGQFTTYSGSTVNRIARLNLDGTLDTTFASGLTGFNSDVNAAVTESNGKIVCGGAFTTYTGLTNNRIIRLNENGSVDADFKTNNGVTTVGATVYSVAVQSDGKIVFGGSNVNTYSGSLTSTRIFRVESSGSIDPTFKTGAGLNSGLIFVKQDPTGKLLITGEATTYSGSVINRIARLDASGAIDPTFKTGTGIDYNGLNAYSNAFEFDTSGNIYFTGQFTTYSGSKVNALVKIKNDGSIDPIFSTSGSSGRGFNAKGLGLLLNTSTI